MKAIQIIVFLMLLTSSSIAGGEYQLSITVSGKGYVSSSFPFWITCDGTCTDDYASGAEITLRATPYGDSTFTGWSGACSGTQSTCTVKMDSAKDVTATFTGEVVTEYQLTVYKNGEGIIQSDPFGITIGVISRYDSWAFDAGTTVVLTATPASNSKFVSWGGDCSQTEGNTCTLTMDAEKQVTAEFARTGIVTYGLSVEKTGDGSGVVTSGTDIDCGERCSSSFNDGESVTLTAGVLAGSVFTGWSGLCSGTSTCTITMNQDRTITAVFSKESGVKAECGVPGKRLCPGTTCKIDDDPPCFYGCKKPYVSKLYAQGYSCVPCEEGFFYSAGVCINNVPSDCGGEGQKPCKGYCKEKCDDEGCWEVCEEGECTYPFVKWAGIPGVTGELCRRCEPFEEYVERSAYDPAICITPEKCGDLGQHPCVEEKKCISYPFQCPYDCSPSYIVNPKTGKCVECPAGEMRVDVGDEEQAQCVPACGGLNQKACVYNECNKTTEPQCFNGCRVPFVRQQYVGQEATCIECRGDSFYDGSGGCTSCGGLDQAPCDKSICDEDPKCFNGCREPFVRQQYVGQEATCIECSGSYVYDGAGACVSCGGLNQTPCDKTICDEDPECFNGCKEPYVREQYVGQEATCIECRGDSFYDDGACVNVFYNLSVSKEGEGTVTAPFFRIYCGQYCISHYLSGTTVELTAYPDTGSTFEGWKRDCSGKTCALVLDGEKHVTAVFKGPTPEYTLTVQKTGLGTVTAGKEIDCGDRCSSEYEKGAVVELTATPDEGMTFVGWGGPCTHKEKTCDVTMNAARHVTATFSEPEKRYTLTVSKTGTGKGFLQSFDHPIIDVAITCGDVSQPTCVSTFPAGTTIRIITGFDKRDTIFEGWEGDCTSDTVAHPTHGVCYITLDSDKSVTGKFTSKAQQKLKELRVTQKGPGRSKAPVTVAETEVIKHNCWSDCSWHFPAGTTVTLTGGSNSQVMFERWGGACSGSATSCTLTMDGPKNVSAWMYQRFYSTSVSKSGTGVGVVYSNDTRHLLYCGKYCTRRWPRGKAVTLIAKPDKGYIFEGWGGACSGNATSCTVILNDTKDVTAVFSPKPPKSEFRLSVSIQGNGVVASPVGGRGSWEEIEGVRRRRYRLHCNKDCTSDWPRGTSITLTADPANGYRFKGWEGACKGTTCGVIMDDDRQVTAVFTAKAQEYQLTVSKEGPGRVTANDTYLDCGTLCSPLYENGTVVTLKARPLHKFMKWGGDVDRYGLEVEVTMDAPKHVIARFKECLTDSHCALDQSCQYSKCVSVSCPCGVVKNHRCLAYGCCADSECGKFEKCNLEVHKCLPKPGCQEVIKNGNSADKLDLVFVGDGYTDYASLKKDILKLVEPTGRASGRAIDGLFTVSPFKEKKNKFNVWMVLAPDYKYQKDGRPVVGDYQRFVRTCERDSVVVLSYANYRSFAYHPTIKSRGGVAYVSPRRESAIHKGRLLLHEVGHSIGDLADEYVEEGKKRYYQEPNCAAYLWQAKKWWGDLVGMGGVDYYTGVKNKPGTKYHKSPKSKGDDGGCAYVRENIRPTINSLMINHMQVKDDFGPVNKRELRKKLEEYK